MKTTIGKIKSFEPCIGSWEKLISFHGEDLEKELSPMDILKSNRIKDAVWSLRAFDNQNKVRLFTADIAESVLYIFENQYPNDDRPRKAIEAARKFVNGEISEKELKIARAAAYNARDTAAYAAAYAACDAACDAAVRAAYVNVTYTSAVDARSKKWQEIEKLFINNFKS